MTARTLTVVAAIDDHRPALRTLMLPVLVLHHRILPIVADELHLLIVQLLVLHVEPHPVVVLDSDRVLLIAPLVRAHPLAHAHIARRHATHPLVRAHALPIEPALIHLNGINLDEVAAVDHVHRDHRRAILPAPVLTLLAEGCHLGRALIRLVKVQHLQRVNSHVLIKHVSGLIL